MEMKKIGIVLIIAAFILGIVSDYLPKESSIEPVVGLSFFYFLLGLFILIKTKGWK